MFDLLHSLLVLVLGTAGAFLGFGFINLLVFGILQFLFNWSNELTNFLIFAPATAVAVYMFIIGLVDFVSELMAFFKK